VGRILAEPVAAAAVVPQFPCRRHGRHRREGGTTFGASESRPKDLAVGTQARFHVNTGHVMPQAPMR
jgi:putative molybdopterin biosynthesis protein